METVNNQIFTSDASAQRELTTSDIFDKVSDQFMQKDLDQVERANRLAENPENTDNTDEQPEQNTEQTSTDENTEETTETTTEETPAFKPIKFSRKIGGEDVNFEIKSESELNHMLAKGYASDGLYSEHKKLKNEMEPLRQRAKLMDAFDNRVKENPLEVIKMIAEEHMPEEEFMQYVHDTYSEYSKLANMSKEEREREREIRDARKLRARLDEIEREKEQIAAKTKEQEAMAWTNDKRTWANNELQGWMKKIPKHHENLVKTAIISLADQADKLRANGQPVNFKAYSRMLKDVIGSLANPTSQDKSRSGKALRKESQAATKIVQNSTRNATRNNSNGQTTQNTAKDTSDIWDEIANAALSRKLNVKP